MFSASDGTTFMSRSSEEPAEEHVGDGASITYM